VSSAEIAALPSARPQGRRLRGAAGRMAAAAFLVALAAFALAPVASVVHIALGGDTDVWRHLAAYVLPAALRDTALLLGGVAVVAGTIGIGCAFLVTACEFPGRRVLLVMLPLPLAIPTYIAAYVYVDVADALLPATSALVALLGLPAHSLDPMRAMRSVTGAVFVIGLSVYPYVYLAARAMFQTQGAALAEAARLLGAGPLTVAWHISVPLARPALAVGLSLALLETLNDIGASEYLGVRTLTVAIYTTWLNRGSLEGAAQIAAVMLVAVTALIALERFGRRRQQFVTAAQDRRGADRIALGAPAGLLAALACAIPVVLGVLLPCGFLLREVIVRGLITGFDQALVGHALTTVGLAAAAAAGVILLGFAAAMVQRLIRAVPAAPASLAGIGYAVPGTVLALGLLAPLVAADGLINQLSVAVTGVKPGLVLAGSSAAVVIAYVIRFLAIGIGFGQAGLARVPGELDDVARLMGARPAQVARGIHLPLLRPALAGAALLVFVDCLKELPATLLLRPLNVETLSTYVYQFATRGSFEDGALAALIIVAAAILPVLYIVRHADAAAAVR
jgi:iron(III) transport system permease protein